MCMGKDFDNKKTRHLKVVCDFDGTISSVDTTDAILNRFAPPEWEEVEKEWVSGNIDAHECMSRQIAMLKIDKTVLNCFLENIPLTRGFVAFAKFAQKNCMDISIVSDGLDYVINFLLTHYLIFGIPVLANHLVIEKDGFCLEFPHNRDGCGQGVCKCALTETNGEDAVVLIGDGRSDFCLAEKADLVLARSGSLLEKYCEEKGLKYTAFVDFHEVRETFEWLDSVVEINDSDILQLIEYRNRVVYREGELVND